MKHFVLRSVSAIVCCFSATACTESVAKPPPSAISTAPVDDQTLKSYATAVMQRFDINKDGRLSEYEFTRATIAMFQTMDVDHDGSLTEPELGKKWGIASSRADTNGDKSLSLMEVLKDQEAEFKKYDTNHDGFLSLEELENLIRTKAILQRSE